MGSRDAGLAHIDELADEWAMHIDVPRATIHTYLSRNIHYILDDECLTVCSASTSLRRTATRCLNWQGFGCSRSCTDLPARAAWDRLRASKRLTAK